MPGSLEDSLDEDDDGSLDSLEELDSLELDGSLDGSLEGSLDSLDELDSLDDELELELELEDGQAVGARSHRSCAMALATGRRPAAAPMMPPVPTVITATRASLEILSILSSSGSRAPSLGALFGGEALNRL